MTDAQKKLDNLTNALVEDFLKAPDEEVLADALIALVQKERAGRLAAEARLAQANEAAKAGAGARSITDEMVLAFANAYAGLHPNMTADFVRENLAEKPYEMEALRSAIAAAIDANAPASAPPQTLLETACRAALGCLDDPTGGTHVEDMRAAAKHLSDAIDTTSPTPRAQSAGGEVTDADVQEAILVLSDIKFGPHFGKALFAESLIDLLRRQASALAEARRAALEEAARAINANTVLYESTAPMRLVPGGPSKISTMYAQLVLGLLGAEGTIRALSPPQASE